TPAADGIVERRPRLPALISRIPRSTSAPTSRFRSAIECLPDFSQHVDQQILGFVSPRFPRPLPLQRSFRTPPDPGTTAPPCGCMASQSCSSAYSSASRYLPTIREKSRVSTNVSTLRLYCNAV